MKNNKTPKAIRVFFLFLSIAIASCASKPSSEPSAIKQDLEIADELSICRQKPASATYPRNQSEKNETLYRLLQSIVGKKNKSGSIKLRDLTCSLSMSGDRELTRCSYILDGKQKVSAINKSKDAEELRMFLFNYPLSQGDSGVAARSVECDLYEKYPECWLSIPIDFQAP